MTKIRHQRHYRAYYIHHNENKNIFLGVAFELERPVKTIIESFWNVLTSPTDGMA